MLLQCFLPLREVVVPAFTLKSQIVLVFLYSCVLVVVLLVLAGFGTKLSTISFWRHINITSQSHKSQVTQRSRSSSSSYLNPQLPITISRHSSQYWLSTRALLSWSPSSVMAATKPSRKTKLMLMQQNVIVAMQ